MSVLHNFVQEEEIKEHPVHSKLDKKLHAMTLTLSPKGPLGTKATERSPKHFPSPEA